MEITRNEAYARTLSSMIQCETVSETGQTDLSKFRRFHALIKSLFPKLHERAEVEEFSGSLLIRLKGKDASKQPVMLMSHHDVVEASGEWTHAPFSGDIADGKVWGRGTIDTKNSLFAMLQAVEETLCEGFLPERDIYIESACTEETDGSGANAISRTLNERGIRFYMTLDEGGTIMREPIPGADGVFAIVGVGEKGCADIKFIARSKGGHASTPGKNTPLVRLGKFMAAAEDAKLFTAYMSPVVAEMFTRLAPSMKGGMGFLLKNAKTLRGLLTAVMPSVSPMAGAMLKTTLAFTMCSGSNGSNVLPQEAWVIGNMRYSHHQGGENSIDEVRQLAAKYDIETVVLDPGFASPVSSCDSEPFKLVEHAVSAVFKGVKTIPYIMTGASDSRYFGRVCDDCLRFAPFLISDEQLASMHGIDENVDVATLSGAVDFYKYIIKNM